MSKLLKTIIFSIVSTAVVATSVVCGIVFGDTSIKQLLLDTSSAKLVFDITEDFSYDGLVVKGKQKVGGFRVVEDFEVDTSNFSKGQVGTYTIQVKCDDATDSYEVEIKDKGTLAITKNSDFVVGQDFESNSPILTYTSTQGETETVSDYYVKSFQPNSIGNHNAEILAYGFEYEVEYSVVENNEWFENIIYNVAAHTTEDQVTFADFLWWNADYPTVEPGEHHCTIVLEDFVYRNSSWGDNKGWAMKDGLAILLDGEGNLSTVQYDTQEEALQAIGEFTCSRLGVYDWYMGFIQAAQDLIESDGLEYTIETVKDDAKVTVTIVLYNNKYVAVYNTNSELFEDIYVYENDYVVNIYNFTALEDYSAYMPPVV